MAISGGTNRGASGSLALFGDRLIDDAHMTWIAAEVESEHALHAWFDGAASNRTSAYMDYRAAVDREEAAAHDLRRLCELTWPYQVQLAHSR